jgi:surfeit locus 1 family protein
MASVTAPFEAGFGQRLRPLLWPGLMTAVMLAILLALGTWQLHRLAWKEAILARIDAAERAPAVPLPSAPRPFQKVIVHGRFVSGPTALYGVEVRDTARGPIMGGQLLSAFRSDDGRLILVDRGWVPASAQSRVPAPSGETDVTGFARAPERPWVFGAPDDPAHHQFFTLDPARIAAALGLHGAVAPFTLVALGDAPPGAVPQPAEHLPRPPNNHLSYALTWYGLALSLAVVFLSWARKRLSTP